MKTAEVRLFIRFFETASNRVRRITAVDNGFEKPNKRSDFRYLKKTDETAFSYTARYLGFFQIFFPWELNK
jgi:hypothetical protein